MEYKAYALMAILLSSVAAVGMLGNAYAQTGLTVEAESTDANTVTISGNVGTVVAGQPVLLQVYNPNGAAYRIDQIPAADIGTDGAYSYDLRIGGNLGINGEYNARVTYNQVTEETTFEFTGGQQPGSEWSTATLIITGEDGETSEYEIEYMMEGGELNELTGDAATATITAMITADAAGQLTIKLPRNVTDSVENDEDVPFIVFVDEQEFEPEDDMGETERILVIDFEEGSEQIDIVGTFMIPEFGAIAAIVLAVAIVGIIVATTRYSKFSFLPKM